MRLREAGEAVASGSEEAGLSATGVREALFSARDAVKEDPGLGGEAERGRVAALLSSDPAAGGVEHLQLEEIAREADTEYLARWAAALATPHNYGTEYAARQIASHLLDSGSSETHLSRWWRSYSRAAQEHSVAELLARAADELTQPQEFEVLVPVAALSGVDDRPPGWIADTDVNNWLRANNFPLVPEQHGGIIRRETARDPGAAVAIVTDVVETYRARLSIGTRSSGFRTTGKLYVAGTEQPFRYGQRRRVEVHTLEREKKLFADVQLGIVDSALSLLSHLDYGAPAAAVAGGWAAVESLLKGAGDGGAHQVAPRLAALVACSFPRAELTKLAWQRVKAQDDQISSDLRGLDTNKSRAAYVAAILRGGGTLNLTSIADQAAEERMTKIISSPKEAVTRVRSLAEDPLRRLYRQRNLVLHSGRTHAVALRSTLRVGAPLMGAALDRIAHAWFSESVDPLRTAAIAELRIGRLGGPDEPLVEALLH
jgi:hypothetical protein